MINNNIETMSKREDYIYMSYAHKKTKGVTTGRLLAVYPNGRTEIVMENMPFPILQKEKSKRKWQTMRDGAKLIITY